MKYQLLGKKDLENITKPIPKKSESMEIPTFALLICPMLSSKIPAATNSTPKLEHNRG